MKKRESIIVSVLIMLFFTITINATEQSNTESKITGFFTATAGSHGITFPSNGPAGDAIGEDVGFENVYGSKNGLSYGVEAGIGLGEIGLFGVLRYRLWEKNGQPVEFGDFSFDGNMEWSQSFLSIGGRYYFVQGSKKNKSYLPFIGAGIIHSNAKESMIGEVNSLGYQEYVDISMELDGTGYYLESGADFFIASNISIRGIVEYSKLQLGVSEQGIRSEIDGGGGVFVGVSISAFFGKQMKVFWSTLFIELREKSWKQN